MTGEERWSAALAEEAAEPTEWSPDVEALRAALAARLDERGCAWPELAVLVLEAHGHSSVEPAAFAARLGLSEDALRALEGG